MNEMVERIRKIGIVPVVVIEDAKDAVPLADALCEGGIPCAEITFRTSAAEEAIRRIAESRKDMLVGAGTVLSAEQADCAIKAGAGFIVSPGLNPEVITFCKEKNVTVIPGCATPSEIEVALRLGLETVKFFPAEAAGGIKMIRAMAAPYKKVTFMPTGGINEANLKDYLDFNQVIACGGTWMIDNNMLRAGDFVGIKKLTEKAVSRMLNLHFLCRASDPEIMIQTDYVERAIYHLSMRGYHFLSESAEQNDKGYVIKIRLCEEMNGKSLYLIKA